MSLPGGKRKSVYGKTKKEAREALKVALKKLDEGVDLGAPAQTLGVFLEHWLADSVRPRLAPKTHKTYRDLMRVHVIPALGTTRLDRLTAQQVATLLREKTDEGLSPATVGHIRSVLRNALNRAVKWNLIVRNPVVLTDPPRQERRRVVPLAPEEARIVLEAAKGHRLEALFTVALFLGLRQGEILGLRWADVDLEAGTLQRHAGTAAGRRQAHPQGTQDREEPAATHLAGNRCRRAACASGPPGVRAAGGRGSLERIGTRLHHDDRHAH